MATVSDDGSVPRRQRAVQRGLTRLLVRDMRKLRALIVPSRLQQTVPAWIAAVDALIRQYGETSASLAADFFDAQRDTAGVSGSFTVPLPDAPPPEQVEASLRWASKDVWPRDASVATEVQLRPIEERLDAAEARAEQVAQKLVADQGRETVRQAVREDRQAVGYARAAALGACAFCRLMASRGMVYASADTAGEDANDRFLGDGTAKYHNSCSCCVIPVFRGQRFELSAHAAEWDRLYQEYAAPYPGDQLRRFRQAIAEHG